MKKYVKIAEPLNDLLKKETKWQWSENQENTFKIMKKNLCEGPILVYFDGNLHIEIHFDAFDQGIGAI